MEAKSPFRRTSLVLALGGLLFPLVAAATIVAGADDFRISEMGPVGDVMFDAEDVAVAYNGDDREFLVVWVSDDDVLTSVGEREVFAQRIDAITGLRVGGPLRLSDAGPDDDPLFDAEDPAVAYNATEREYLVVWEADDGIDGENEIYGQRLNRIGAEIGDNDFRISDVGPNGDSLYDGRGPAVAWSSESNVYLVVWEGDDNNGGFVEGENEIYGQRLTASGTEIGTNDFRISDMGPDGDPEYDAANPAVAYNPDLDQFLVVWDSDDNIAPQVERENEIFGQRITSVGSEVGPSDFRISDMGPDGAINHDAERPDVAYNPFSEEYLVVWLGDDDTPPLVEGEDEIFGQRLDSSGSEIGSNDFRISDAGTDGLDTFDAVHPAIEIDPVGGDFLVVWEADDNAGLQVEGEHEIFAQRLSSTGAALGPNDLRLTTLGPNGNNLFDAGNPALAFSGSEFLVVWEGDDDREDLVDGEKEIFGQRVVTRIPALRTSGTCPGDVTLEVEGGLPGATIAILGSPTTGAFLVPAGSCAGTPTDLENPSLLSTAGLNGSGDFSVTLSLNSGVCGLLIEIVDLGVCETTNVSVIP